MSETKRKRELPALSRQQTIELLASAVNYCQQSGLVVRALNNGNNLVLTIEGARVEIGEQSARFVADDVPASFPARGEADGEK